MSIKKYNYLFIFLFIIFFSSILYSQTVYITDTGTKYHNWGCRYLNDSKHAVTLEYAFTHGYTRCSVCNPPIYDSIESPLINPIDFKISPLFPNPFNSSTTLRIKINTKMDINILISNINGQLLHTVIIDFPDKGEYNYQIDFSEFTSGIYFITVLSENYNLTQKAFYIK